MKRDSLNSAPVKKYGAGLNNGKMFLMTCLVASLMSASYADTITIPTPTLENPAYSFVNEDDPIHHKIPVKVYTTNTETGATTSATKYVDIGKTTYSDGTVTYTFTEGSKMGVEYTKNEADPETVSRVETQTFIPANANAPINGNGKTIIYQTINNSAILNEGTMKVTADFVDNHKTEGNGGAIYNNGTATFIHGDFIDNSAHVTSGSTSGGAIYNSVDGVINDITGDFIGNHILEEEGDIGNGAWGGAIFNYGTIDSINGNFIGNYAFINSTNSTLGFGGAIGNRNTIGTIVGDFIGNHSSSVGGAIANLKTIESITGDFINNTANLDGGAIYNNHDGTISNINGNYIQNQAKYGGAIYNEKKITNINGTFSQNNATEHGGAIYNNTASPNEDTIIENIEADFYSNSAGKQGGAIYNAGGFKIGQIEGNFIENTAGTDGGAIYNSTGSIDSIVGNFIENTSSTDGGAVYNTGTIGYYIENPEILTGLEGDFIKNTSTNGDGGAIFNNGIIFGIAGDFRENTATNGDGGAIYNEIDGAILYISGDFNSNTSSNIGGAIYNDGTISYIMNSNFSNNTTKEKGGAIYNSDYIGWLDGGFTNNQASDGISGGNGDGGAIYNDSTGTIGIITGDFTENMANKNGSAIYNLGTIGYTDEETGESYGIIGNFTNNGTSFSGKGGAIYNKGTIHGIDGSFKSNYADMGNGGAIYNDENGTIKALNGNFISNRAGVDGGALYDGGAIFNKGNIGVENSTTPAILGDFDGNFAGTGGAVYNDETGKIYGIKGNFSNNIAGSAEEPLSTDDGGAIYNLGHISYVEGDFDNNTAQNEGGAIYNLGEIGKEQLNITPIKSNFNSNTATRGGAIYNNGTIHHAQPVGGVDPSIVGNFNSNIATEGGGAIYNNTNGNIDAIRGNFSGNIAGNAESPTTNDDGGAIYNNGTIGTIYGNFDNNKAHDDGGAILNHTTGKINAIYGDFTNNEAKDKGGAIHNYGTITVTGNFRNNTAGNSESGGAIHNNQGTVNLNSYSNMVFEGNKAGDKNIAIYNNNGGTEETKAVVNMNVGKGGYLVFNDKVTGDDSNGNAYNEININNFGEIGSAMLPTTGTVAFNDTVSNHTITLYDGTMKLGKDNVIDGNDLVINGGKIDMGNGTTGTAHLDTLTLKNDADLKIDVDFKKGGTDKIIADEYIFEDGKLHITDLNVLSDPKDGNVTIQLAEDELKDYIELDTVTLNRDIMSPIGKYTANYDSSSGSMGLKRTGFNPAILASPIAAQLGGYLNSLNSYEQAFNNLDMRMNYDNQTRNAFKFANKYANAGNTTVYSPTYLQEKNAGIWFKPYVSYESVGLKNGPKVDNTLYGAYFGGDSPVYSFKNGVDMQYSLYAGYNGSHQSYTDTGIYQNGGILGATALLYKDNFFTALTLNAGASFGDASTKYGNEDFTTFSTGVASKTGYNIEFADGKFIVQPSMLLSYTFVNTFDYTNAAGVRIDADPIHAINISPGLKFIGNLGNGWQPYFGARMIWNILDKADYYANDVSLPSLSVKPYVQYGFGVQKLWGERSTGFAQFMVRNGGRNGIAFNVGYRYALGK